MTHKQPLTWKAFQKENLSIMVEEYIKDNILKGVFKGGDRLIETDIAEELGISRGPVREGIKAVAQTGIITLESRRGAYVTKFDEESIQELFEIRLLLETSIFEDIIRNEKVSESDIGVLEALVEEMIEIAHDGELDQETAMLAVNKKDIEFHQYIWRMSSSLRKEKILNEHFFQLRIAMLYDTKATENLLKTATDHFAIINFLREGDINSCRQALIDHIETYSA